jgi:long-chain fatty acid transport protein
LCVLLIIGVFTIVSATNGYQLIGVGANQKSMAGAVTAHPMDPMTAVTNPAGMARIGHRADFSMEAFLPVRSVDFSMNGGEKTEGGSEMYGIPSLGWVASAFNSDDLFFGGGMYATSGLGVDYGQSIFMPGSALDQMAGAPSGSFQDVTFDGYSGIQFWKMAPTLAWNVTSSLSLGFSINVDYQSVTIRQAIRNVPFWNNPADPMAGLSQMDVRLDLGRPTSQFGFGATMGFLYDLHPMVTVGASYVTEQSFSNAEFRVGTGDVMNFNGATGVAGIYMMDLDFPQIASFGLAVRPLPRLVLDFDLKWINWSSTHDEVDFKGPDNAFDTNGDGIGDAAYTVLDFGWDDQTVFAIGVQYQIMDDLAFRAGYNTAKAPIDEADVFNNLILPATVEQHLTAGLHYFLGDHWGIGSTVMIASEKEIEGRDDVPAGFQQLTPFSGDSGAKIALKETSLDIQLSYRF